MRANGTKKMKVRDLDLYHARVGMFACYDTMLDERRVGNFAELTGDISPLHVEKPYGKSTPYGKNLVHGMLAASHFSTIAGVLLPGRNALLNHVEADFIRPIPVGSKITVSGKISGVSHATSSITLDLAVFCEGEICVTGKALVTVRD